MTFKQSLTFIGLLAAINALMAFGIVMLTHGQEAPKVGTIGDAPINGALTATFATVSNSNTSVLPAAPERMYALICNDGSNAVYLAVGTTAVAGRGLVLEPNGGCYEINDQNQLTGAINGITSSGSSNVTVIYK